VTVGTRVDQLDPDFTKISKTNGHDAARLTFDFRYLHEVHAIAILRLLVGFGEPVVVPSLVLVGPMASRMLASIRTRRASSNGMLGRCAWITTTLAGQAGIFSQECKMDSTM